MKITLSRLSWSLTLAFALFVLLGNVYAFAGVVSSPSLLTSSANGIVIPKSDIDRITLNEGDNPFDLRNGLWAISSTLGRSVSIPTLITLDVKIIPLSKQTEFSGLSMTPGIATSEDFIISRMTSTFSAGLNTLDYTLSVAIPSVMAKTRRIPLKTMPVYQVTNPTMPLPIELAGVGKQLDVPLLGRLSVDSPVPAISANVQLTGHVEEDVNTGGLLLPGNAEAGNIIPLMIARKPDQMLIKPFLEQSLSALKPNKLLQAGYLFRVSYAGDSIRLLVTPEIELIMPKIQLIDPAIAGSDLHPPPATSRIDSSFTCMTHRLRIDLASADINHILLPVPPTIPVELIALGTKFNAPVKPADQIESIFLNAPLKQNGVVLQA